MKKSAPRQASQTRKSSEKDKISAERKKRSSSTGKVVGDTKRADDKANKKKLKEDEQNEESTKKFEAIDIPPAEVKIQNYIKNF